MTTQSRVIQSFHIVINSFTQRGTDEHFAISIYKRRRRAMTAFDAEAFDVAVIGAGHAGIEAALASARLGAKTA